MNSRLAARALTVALSISLVVPTGAALAQTFEVKSFAPSTNTQPGVWYEFDIRDDGEASTVNLIGVGGDLEGNQPSPLGAALLTTGSSTGDKAEVGVIDDFGMPMDILSTLTIEYSYYKVGVGAPSAAPSLKITVFNPTCDDPASSGDCFGTLVYEPTWNGPGSSSSTPMSSIPPTDEWTTVTIDRDNGLFWWTGGFGQPNTAGGPPIRTLGEWETVFSSDFGDASFAVMSIGVGTFNLDQVGYFDDVTISHAAGGGFSKTYDFGPTPCGTVADVAPCAVNPATIEGSDVADDDTVVVVHYNAGTTPGTAGPSNVAFLEIRDAQFESSPTLTDPENYALNAILVAPTSDGSNVPPSFTTLDSMSSDFGEPGFGGQSADWVIDYHDGSNASGDLAGSRFHTVLFGDVCEYTDTVTGPGEHTLEWVLRFPDQTYHSINNPEIRVTDGTFVFDGSPVPDLDPVDALLFGRIEMIELQLSSDAGLFSGSADAGNGFVGVWRTTPCRTGTLSSVGEDLMAPRITSPLWINPTVDPIIEVEFDMACLTQPVVGFQAFTEFSGPVAFSSGAYTPAPFGLPIIDPIVAAGSRVDLGAGIDVFGGQTATQSDALLATLEFDATGTGSGDVFRLGFDRTAAPPSRYTAEGSGEVAPVLGLSAPVRIDDVPPVLSVPADVAVPAEAGSCEATVAVGAATATDDLDPHPYVTGVRSDALALDDPYPAGVTTITWTATDKACNETVDVQTITVDAFNELLVDVELAGGIDPGPFTRCITFELFLCGGGSMVVEQDVVFTGGFGSATVLVPCGAYDCITARDAKHTLRRTDDDGDFGIVGTQYVADFTSGGGSDDSLVGGNLNDDLFVDILDFGIFVGQYASVVGADTTCGFGGVHADVSGNGVVFTEDFTFIQSNFLAASEANCCGLPGFRGDGLRPTERISVAELLKRGLPEAAAGDLNGDGWVDGTDVKEFARGVRPARSDRPLPRR